MSEFKGNEMRSTEEMSFEECYSELQGLVEQFEKGQMLLEESVDRFERGMLLLKRCNNQLGAAESRVETLLRRIEPDAELNDDKNDLDNDCSDNEQIPF